MNYALDGYLKTNLDTAKRVVRSDWDMVFVIDGTEGGGKSVIGQQCAAYVDPTFNISRICFTPQDFIKCVEEADNYQAIIYDESYGGLGSRGTMSNVNKTLVKMLTEIRFKNLFIFIIIPTFFDMDKYVALWRSRALIHVYAGHNFTRGQFQFYGKDSKKYLYIMGKQTYSYNKPRADFIGRFSNTYTVDEKEYREKKRKIGRTGYDTEIKTKERIGREIKKEIAANLYDSHLGLSKEDISKILGISRMTLHRYMTETVNTDSKIPKS